MKITSRASSHVFQADCIRLLAVVGVVLIHLVYSVYGRSDFLGGSSWWLANLLNTFSHTAVPLFLMLSGFLVLPKDESLAQTWHRTWKRLGLPLIFWFLFYLWWNDYYLTKPTGLLEALGMVFISNMFHLYFLVILIGLYLLLPVWRLVMALPSRTLVWALVGLSFLSGVVITLLQYTLFREMSLVTTFTIWWLYLGYFLLGRLLLEWRVAQWQVALVSGSAFALTMGLGYVNVWLKGQGWLWLWRPSGVSYFDEYLSPNIIVMSVGLFLVLLRSDWLGRLPTTLPRLARLISLLSQAAFATYLVHFVIIDILNFRFRYAIEFLETGLMEYLVTRVFWGVTLSLLVGLVLVRVPLLKRLVGEK